MTRKEAIEQQIVDLQRKAVERPGLNDQMNMVGFGSTLLAAKIVAW
jgi:hypothetical protein